MKKKEKQALHVGSKRGNKSWPSKGARKGPGRSTPATPAEIRSITQGLEEFLKSIETKVRDQEAASFSSGNRAATPAKKISAAPPAEVRPSPRREAVRLARPKPWRLAEKLLRIRQQLGLSQSQLIRRLYLQDRLEASRISAYECGKREPDLMVLLAYARAAGINIEALVDDKLDLPDRLPGKVNHEQIKSAYVRKRSGG